MSRVRIECPTCAAALEIMLRPGVDVVRCPKCSKPMRVPTAAPPKKIPVAAEVDADDEPEEEEDEEVRPSATRRPKRRKRRQSLFVKAPFVIAGVALVALAVVLTVVVSSGGVGAALSRALAAVGASTSDSKPIPDGPFKGCRPEDFMPPDDEIAVRIDVRPKRFFSSAFFQSLNPSAQSRLRERTIGDGRDKRSPADYESLWAAVPVTPGKSPGFAVMRFTEDTDFKFGERADLQASTPEPGITTYTPRGFRLDFHMAQPGPGIQLTGSNADYLAKRMKAARPGAGYYGPKVLARVKFFGFRKLRELKGGELPAAVTTFMNTLGDDATGEFTIDADRTLSLKLELNAATSEAAAEVGRKINDSLQGASGMLIFAPPNQREKLQKTLNPLLEKRAKVSGTRITFDVEIDAAAVNALADMAGSGGRPF